MIVSPFESKVYNFGFVSKNNIYYLQHRQNKPKEREHAQRRRYFFSAFAFDGQNIRVES